MSVSLNTGAAELGHAAGDSFSGLENLIGSDHDDNLRGGLDDNMMWGGSGADRIDAAWGDDTIEGGTGGDDLLGSLGNDTIRGGDGDDMIQGQEDDDTLDGGAGADELHGQAGADTFRFHAGELMLDARDVIVDFDAAGDTIDLSAIDANDGLTGDQDFVWAAGLTGAAGELIYNASTHVLDGDVDGDGVADLSISVSAALVDLQASVLL